MLDKLKFPIKTKTFLSFLFGLLIFSLALFVVSKNIFIWSSKKMIHEDEILFIERGKYFDWYKAGDFKREDWQYFASYDVPKFAEYFYGFAISNHFKEPAVEYLTESGFYGDEGNFVPDWKRNVLRKQCCFLEDMDPSLLDMTDTVLVARKYALYFFVLPLLVLLFLVAKRVYGFIFALFSLLIIGTNVLFVETVATAMGDTPLWLFFILFLFLSLTLVKDFKKKAKGVNILFLFLLGVTFGLACSTKLNGVIIFVYWLSVVFILKKEKLISKKELFFYIFFVGLIGFVTFFILNPFIWSKPITGSIYMAKHRKIIIDYQQASEEFVGDELFTIGDKLAAVYRRTLSLDGYYTNFKVAKWNFFSSFSLDLFIIILGIIPFFYNFLKSKRKKSFIKKKIKILSIEQKLFISFLISLFITTTCLLPLDWNRYYMPFVFVWGFLIAFIISAAIKKALDNN